MDNIVFMLFNWGWVFVGIEEDLWNGGRVFDVVFGVDIIYDKSIIWLLVSIFIEIIILYF